MFRYFLLIPLLLTGATAFAIVIRHDRDDAKYLALGAKFDAVGEVFGATCTLIAPDWVITAGHVAEEVSPYTSFVKFKGKEYAIDRVYLHPEFLRMGQQSSRDLALLHLSEPVKGITPVSLYDGKSEAGMMVTFVGCGFNGTGLTGPTGRDRKKRGAQNKLERANDTSVFFTFDAPPGGVELEGISGPGDSGGPALVEANGKWNIVGVSSANVSNGHGLCEYGTTEVYARVSTELKWLREKIKSKPASNVTWAYTKAWPVHKAGEVGAALLKAFNSGDAPTMEQFNVKYRAASALARRTPEQRAENYLKYFKEMGAMELREIATTPGGKMVALVYSPQKKVYRQLSLFFDGPTMGFEGYGLEPAKARGD